MKINMAIINYFSLMKQNCCQPTTLFFFFFSLLFLGLEFSFQSFTHCFLFVFFFLFYACFLVGLDQCRWHYFTWFARLSGCQSRCHPKIHTWWSQKFKSIWRITWLRWDLHIFFLLIFALMSLFILSNTVFLHFLFIIRITRSSVQSEVLYLSV